MNTPRWLVRPPNLTDIEPLAAIATAVSPTQAPIDADQISWFMAQTDGRFWTITQQDRPIGYATLVPLPGLPHLFELSGGIAPQFQRQGAGSYLWRTMRQELAGMAPTARPTPLGRSGQAVQEITYTVPSLDTPTARFLQRHQFTLEHEEWTMRLDDLPAAQLPPADLPGKLKPLDRAAAVGSLPTLYERCFSGTPWFQAYTTAEVAATWEPTDALYKLVVGGQSIGFVWLHFPEPDVVEIEPIGIIKNKQGMGYGRFLLTTTLQQLQNQGVQTVSLGVWANNQIAIDLYQKLGFRPVSSSYSLTYNLAPT